MALPRTFVNLQEQGFKVMQWNTLADSLALDFPKAPQQALDWSFRAPLILSEISNVDPLILCAQEVDHFEDFLLPELDKLGYSGIFTKKKDWHKDGTAIFFKKEVELLWSHVHWYSQSNQFFLATKLRFCNTELYVVSTHLKAKKPYENIRTSQAKELVNYLEALENIPIIVCGDFNSLPDSETQEVLKSSPLGLLNPYQEVLGGTQFTTLKHRKTLEKKTEDYIWYKGLQVTGVYSLPTEEEIGPLALPSEQYPSDHLSLAVRFNL